MVNESSLSGFLLLEFSQVRELQILYFLMFLALYLITVTGNLLIISAVVLDHHLHTPMYFFLMNLALQDIGQVSVVVPKTLTNILMNTRHITYSGCAAQVLFLLFFAGSDIYLLTVMAYDRYVAICNPLQYEMVMNKQACTEMVASVWLSGLLYGTLHAMCTFATPFCSNIVNQFFCEIPQLLKLSCSAFNQTEMGMIVFTGVIALGCFTFVVATYVQILMTVLKLPSVSGRLKAFSTCLPHLMVFSIYLLTGSITYLKPTSNTASYLDVLSAVIYSMVPPMLNPLIYSMRNQEIKVSLSKLLARRHFPQSK
ncbi:olfactory receptor 14J1-like [Tiliqua scincoides]|uniref:olfactory receptor 14J1-like n=1 Tax=Tiliqua scincoides TaxID=71010 RepID=UPI00346185AE